MPLADSTVYYSPFYDLMEKGWFFLLPAKHGPVVKGKPSKDVTVGPYADRDTAQRQANVTYNATTGLR